MSVDRKGVLNTGCSEECCANFHADCVLAECWCICHAAVNLGPVRNRFSVPSPDSRLGATEDS